MSNETRELHHYRMSGARIPHSENPGPQVTCAHCGMLRFGRDFASPAVRAFCASCRAYREHNVPPPGYVVRQPAQGDGMPTEITWSGSVPMPEINAEIRVRMNRIGKARVVRYFVEDGYVGLLVLPLDPPPWYVKQNGRDALCHVFGTEIALPLRCAMHETCERPVTHVDDKGFVYCEPCASARKAGGHRRVRKLRPHELRKLEHFETIRY